MSTTIFRQARGFFTALLMASLLTVITTSCEQENDYSLVGTWELVAPPTEPYNTFTFYSNGTGIYYGPDDWGTDYYQYDFLWQTDGNTLYVDFGDGYPWVYYYQLSGGSLYLYEDGSNTPLVYNIY